MEAAAALNDFVGKEYSPGEPAAVGTILHLNIAWLVHPGLAKLRT
jgi:hypothetical protein